jgi:hypothetical protein
VAASAIAEKSRRDMLNLSLSVDDPKRTLGPDARGEGRGGLAQGGLVSLPPEG